jgi:menaquinone-dependent protoporphyrinogen oxidase
MAILVTYATSQGSTREIAEHIASRLSSRLTSVECQPVEKVTSLEPYTAVILGSAIHAQKWLKPATEFLQRNGAGLSGRPVWAFSVGLGAGMPKWIREKALAGEEKKVGGDIGKYVKVRNHKLFGGVQKREDAGLVWKMLWACFGGRFGDFREWDKIEAWTDMVARDLESEGGPTGTAAEANRAPA